MRRVPCIVFAIFIFGCAPEDSADPNALREYMLNVVEPAAEFYWDSVGTVMTLEGTEEIAPGSAEEWQAVENAARSLAGTGGTLTSHDPGRDRELWDRLSAELVESARKATAAAESRDPDAVFDAGGNVYLVCADCHAAFAPALLQPNFQQAQ